MGVCIHGWVEKRSEMGDKIWWDGIIDIGEYMGHRAWWRTPILGRTKTIEGIFEPIPFEKGIPEKVSEAARFNMKYTPLEFGNS